MPRTAPPAGRRLSFVKVEGLGNDFILLDHRDGAPPPSPAAVRWLCDRHRGVGADGVLEICTTPAGRPWMRLHNADGGRATMCGNGLRCVGLYLAQVGALALGAAAEVHTDAGPRRLTVHRAEHITVQMGAALDGGSATLALPPAAVSHRLDGPIEPAPEAVVGRCVDVGNPHWVHQTEGRPDLLGRLGPPMQRHPAFPDGVNVSVVRHRADHTFDLEVWERGVGPTQACGSAACATAATLWWRDPALRGQTLTLHLPGGTLTLAGTPEAIEMSGPARRVFGGEVELPEAEGV